MRDRYRLLSPEISTTTPRKVDQRCFFGSDAFFGRTDQANVIPDKAENGLFAYAAHINDKKGNKMPYRCETFDPTKTVVIVVDMQNDFVAEGAKLRSAQAAAMVPRLAETLDTCREKGIRIIYTAHVHRRDGSDMGLYDDLYPPIADGSSLIDGTPGAEVFAELTPKDGEHTIKKHRYSGFFATDLDLILREWGIDTVVITGTTTDNCCHATARDAMFRNYRVAFISDLTGALDYPDVGHGAMSAEDVHHSTLVMLAFSTADVMTSTQFLERIAA